MNYKYWTEDELEELKNNYLFWVKHKKEAEKFFNRHWQSIRVKANELGCFSDRTWTDDDIYKLKDNYAYWMENRSDAEKFFGRTFNAIQEKAIKEGCISDYFWTEEEIVELKDNYAYWSKHKKEAEKCFGRSWKTILKKAIKEGCTSSYWWTNDQLDELKNNYSYWSKHKEDAEKYFGRNWGTIAVKAWEEGLKLNFKSNPKILTDCIDMVNGLLLSDGSVESKNDGATGYYSQGCIKKEWLISIKNEFDTYGVECNITDKAIKPPYLHNNKIYVPKPNYRLATRFYAEFGKLRYKWYPKGKKIVPKDIELTPKCVANWYLGDGSITRHKSIRHFSLRLSTNGFTPDDTIFLSDLLNNTLNINSRTYFHYKKKNGLVIHILRQKDVKTFLNYVRNFWIECYAYKFPTDLLHYNQ